MASKPQCSGKQAASAAASSSIIDSVSGGFSEENHGWRARAENMTVGGMARWQRNQRKAVDGETSAYRHGIAEKNARRCGWVI
jgi:hypothetical protein